MNVTMTSSLLSKCSHKKISFTWSLDGSSPLSLFSIRLSLIFTHFFCSYSTAIFPLQTILDLLSSPSNWVWVVLVSLKIFILMLVLIPEFFLPSSLSIPHAPCLVCRRSSGQLIHFPIDITKIIISVNLFSEKTQVTISKDVINHCFSFCCNFSSKSFS